jgi:hypothetical protein
LIIKRKGSRATKTKKLKKRGEIKNSWQRKGIVDAAPPLNC